MKEFPNESKNKWTRIFKKKWFFPALYIVLAAFLLTGVIWYQNMQSNMFEGVDDLEETEQNSNNSQSGQFDEDAESVVQQDEIIEMPVQEEAQTEIVTKFYDHNAEETEQEEAVTFYNDRYYQSTGVDIAADDGEVFDVAASLSGTVDEVNEDPLHGNVVILDHDDDISTYYASLEEVEIQEGDQVEQGDVLGTSGKNLFSEESGNHIHFELRKGDTELDPEDFFNQSLTAVKEMDVEQTSESDSTEELDEDETDMPQESDATDGSAENEEEKTEDNEDQEEKNDSELPKGFSLSFLG